MKKYIKRILLALFLILLFLFLRGIGVLNFYPITLGSPIGEVVCLLIVILTLFGDKIIPLVKFIFRSIQKIPSAMSKVEVLNIVCFLIPMVGLILYITEKDKNLKKAESLGKSALWGLGVSTAIGIISVVVAFAMIP